MTLKFLLAVTALSALYAIGSANGDFYGPCTEKTPVTHTINGPSAVFGCNGYQPGANVTWYLMSDTPRVLQFTHFDTQTAEQGMVDIYAEGLHHGTYSGKTAPGPFHFNGGLIKVTFFSWPCCARPGFKAVLTPSPETTMLRSAQPRSVFKFQEGGFTYFQFPVYPYGKTFRLNVDIFSYSGLKEPQVFTSINGLPYLEKYTYTNATKDVGNGRYSHVLSVASPKSGRYYIGVYLYGSTTMMTATATWTYDLPYLLNGDKINGTTRSEGRYYQLVVPPGTGRLTFQLQLSRELPGGYPIVYIRQGLLPSENDFEFVMDTQRESFMTLPINNPNPHGNPSTNPGVYVVFVTADKPGSGYILQATWA